MIVEMFLPMSSAQGCSNGQARNDNSFYITPLHDPPLDMISERSNRASQQRDASGTILVEKGLLALGRGLLLGREGSVTSRKR